MAARMGLLAGMGLDAKRPTAWAQYGYSDTLGFDHFYRAYSRGGAAFGAVHRLLDKCWEEVPRIKRPDTDDETPWEKKLGDLLKSLKAWQKLRDLDRRNMVGRYAGLIYRVADGKRLSEPMERAAKLVDIVPLFEDQLKVTKWHADETNAETFGKPAMWQYRRRALSSQGDQQGKPDEWADVHPSRVQILAEGAAGGDFLDGVPLLRAGFNALVDLEKVRGGSGESFLKNASRNLNINFSPDVSPHVVTSNPDGTPSGKTVRQVLGEQVDNLNRSIDSVLVTQGADAKALQTTQADPEPAWRVAANDFAASVQIPATILFGQQTGRLASDQDQQDWLARCSSRQVNELTPMLEEFIRRGQAAGWIEAGDFEIEWSDLGAPSDKDKVDLADKMANTNKTAMAYGSRPIYTDEEVRRVGGYHEPIAEDDLPIPPEGGADDDPGVEDDEPPPPGTQA
ncbi:anti-CBASS protein Acb1 family protein [Aquabacterium sp. OR-4]|uniref:anti-CBASS protein Acb1 family protein n=1 Tax=Aquabacterium sp. OR-4 TaxID=2978127 RepID=UPI0028C7422E|nr:anti-CBASS Acb1 family protein [Aquabacterium sp. OR-4]MDT7834973.1 DUF1073 domain-containing protein [Aquabacterium sp. OR-4]